MSVVYNAQDFAWGVIEKDGKDIVATDDACVEPSKQSMFVHVC